jgi:predicted extracellular nuclease
VGSSRRRPPRRRQEHRDRATFNVENLASTSPAEKFAALGATVARNLGGRTSALQEIQDDPGRRRRRRERGATLDRLIGRSSRPADRATVAPDRPRGPARRWPTGGNIRVAFLFNRERVRSADRGDAGPRDACTVATDRHGAILPLTPCRVAPTDRAWEGRAEAGGEGVRKPLAAEFEFAGRRLFLVNLHLSSKLGDDRQFGAVQPPRRPTETQRVAQAHVVREFVGRILGVDPEAAVVILGDCNDFNFAPPLEVLAAPPFENLLDRLPRPERYTYVFQGISQALDHLVVPARLARRAEVDVVHVNAEFPERGRGSDHDPVVGRLRLRD